MHTMGNRSLSVHQMYLTTTLRTVRRYSYKSRTGWITVTVNPEYVPDDSYRGDLIVVSPVSNTGIALHEVFRVLIENCNNRYVSSSSATNSAICLTCLGINCKCIRCFAQTALHFRILKLWKTTRCWTQLLQQCSLVLVSFPIFHFVVAWGLLGAVSAS